MEKLSEDIKKLRIRFISDLNLPIQVIHSPYFENMLDLLEDEYKAKTKYNKLLDFINNGPFKGNINKFIEDFHYVRNKAITYVEYNKSYQFFHLMKSHFSTILSHLPFLQQSRHRYKSSLQFFYHLNQNYLTFLMFLDLFHLQ